MADSAIRSSEYESFRIQVFNRTGLSVRDYLIREVEQHGHSAAEIAAAHGLARQRVYDYARANGLAFTTRTHLIDLTANRAAGTAA